MAITVTITMKGMEPAETDVEEEHTFKDLIEALADAWDVPQDQHVLMRGTDVYEGNTKFSDVGTKQDDVFELIHRDNISQAQTTPTIVSGELSIAIQWLYDNIGLDPDELEVKSDDKQEPLREVEFEYIPDGRIYKIKLDVTTGKINKYTPPK